MKLIRNTPSRDAHKTLYLVGKNFVFAHFIISSHYEEEHAITGFTRLLQNVNSFLMVRCGAICNYGRCQMYEN